MYTWPYFLYLFLKTQKIKRNKLWNRFANTIHSYSAMQFCWTLRPLWLLVYFLDIPYVWKLTEHTTFELLSTITQPVLTVVAVAPERCPPFPSLVSHSPHWGRTVQTASLPAVCLSLTPAPQNSSGGRWATANVCYIDYLYAFSGSIVSRLPLLVSYSKIYWSCSRGKT